jgi:hypothetical protein
VWNWLRVLAFSLLVPLVIGIEKFSRGKLSGGKKTCCVKPAAWYGAWRFA